MGFPIKNLGKAVGSAIGELATAIAETTDWQELERLDEVFRAFTEKANARIAELRPKDTIVNRTQAEAKGGGLMDEYVKERPVSIDRACVDLVPRWLDKEVLPATMGRWIHIGLLDPDDKRIKLKASKFGREFRIYPSDVDKFFEAVTGENRS